MKIRLVSWFMLMLFPMLSSADTSISGSMSFTPPPSDYSVIFLGNLFGIVDGVLHGSGSQIMGTMFGVFNAAVLALGGVVVMYTLIVGTMNTAHEGQMLGQKWSSIWIPVRSTIGLSFLIPKASGYCLMQIFIMWVVVQGVGAADKIWNAALDYLNRGGAIVKAQMSVNSTTQSSQNQAITNIATGAGVILSGEVCMKGIQTLLENQRTNLLANAGNGSGVCSKDNLANPQTSSDIVYFCTNPVPDFISSVNAVNAQNASSTSACQASSSPSSSNFYVKMPNFPDAPYSNLNGVCGVIKWNNFNPDLSGIHGLSCSDIDTTRQSRAVAIQQMYDDFTPVALSMVSNDPQIKISTTNSTSNYSLVAKNQFGTPYLTSGTAQCDSPSQDCTGWGPDNTSSGSQTMILTGFEFQNALLDYNGIMLPALNLVKDSANSNNANKLRAFIEGSERQGWIMAGSYFFDLAYLNGLVTANSDTVDNDSGLNTSDFATSKFTSDPFTPCGTLCNFFGGSTSSVLMLEGLINASTLPGGVISSNVSTSAKAEKSVDSSTVYGYITNGAMVHLPGQPGLSMPTFSMNFNIQPGQTLLSFPNKRFRGFWAPMESFFYNDLFRGIVNVFLSFMTSTFNLIMQTFLYLPLTDLMVIFNNGVQLLQTTMVHPIIALAYMGASFINASVDIWLNLITFSIIFGVLTMGLALIVVVMVLPFLASWLGIMTSIGFIDAYYVPFVPYMIFTFGTLAWLMAVIEAMVAGPIIALGVTHPEGHDALGKAEQAIMILVNVFLRPAMMIIGYIGAIALSYVAVFILNSGFGHIIGFLLPNSSLSESWANMGVTGQTGGTAGTPYTNWAAIYASFFCLVTYTSLYVTVVQKSFSLIHALPDKILRWIGSQGEAYGQDTSQWSEESKGQIKDTGEATGKSSMKSGGQVMGMAESIAVGANKGSSGGSSSAGV